MAMQVPRFHQIVIVVVCMFLMFQTSATEVYCTNAIPALTIHPNGRWFQKQPSGVPFFMLFDTGWNLAALTREEIKTYVESRKTNGFDAVMFALSFEPQAKPENAYGARVFVGPDYTELNPKALEHIDYIVQTCEDNGLYAMIYTLWGGAKAGTMNRYSKDQLYQMGKAVGQYFGGKHAVILVTGGETTPHYIEVEKVNALGEGLHAGCRNRNLIAVHPVSEHSSSEFFSEQTWLDFYMIQGKSSIKGESYDFEPLLRRDLQHPVVKPSFLVEHRYETGTQENAIIQRRSLYSSVFLGASAFGYGHNALWQMTPHTGLPWMLRSWTPGVSCWKEALFTEASVQLKHIKTLIYRYKLYSCTPMQSRLLSKQKEAIHQRVYVCGREDMVCIYVSSPQDVLLCTDGIQSDVLQLELFNPRTGEIRMLEKALPNTMTLRIASSKDQLDWVYIITKKSTNA